MSERDVFEPSFFACADILGFKHMVDTKPLVDIVNAYYQYAGTGDTAGTLHFALGKAALPGQDVDDGTRLGKAVDYAIFSDTTFLWTRDSSAKSLESLLTACGLLIAGGLSNGFPLPFRIGISYGELHIEPDRNLYLGKAIVSAYLTEQAQDWVGGMLDEAASAAFRRLLPGPTAIPRAVVHDVPVHANQAGGQAVVQAHAVNWSFSLGDRQYVRMLLQNLAQNSGAHHAKYERALDFYEKHRPRALP